MTGPVKLDEYLAQEYLHLLKTTDEYAKSALIIKGWFAAAIGAGTIAMLTGRLEINGRALYWLAAFAAALWFSETKWKLVQHYYIARIEEIENHFAFHSSTINPSYSPGALLGAMIAAAGAIDVGRPRGLAACSPRSIEAWRG